MLQNILVLLFIAGAAANIFYSTRKLWTRKQKGLHTCGGCGQCELKKNIVRHGQN